jgi:hypothetical protein
VIHVFVLIMTIGGVEVANDDCREAMCFRSIDTCNEFAAKLRQRGSPSTSIGITAYCKPILVDPTQDGVKEFAAKLRQRGSPSTSIGITAYCKPILVDPTQDGVKVY